MIGAGIIGTVILGFVQDRTIDRNIDAYDKVNHTALHSAYVTEEKMSILGDYKALNLEKLSRAGEQEQQTVLGIQNKAKKQALRTVALFPIGMLLYYVVLLFYFKSKGGYKVVALPHKKEMPAM